MPNALYSYLRAKHPTLVIAIDGFSSTGKSTLAKELAKTLKIRFIDSGAMYRAVTLFAIENGFLNDDTFRLDSLLSNLYQIKIRFEFNEETGENITFLNEKNVELNIRAMQVSRNVSRVAKVPEVREFLVTQQKEFGKEGKVVMDGRDIGTVVFPDADFKFFLTASAEVRAKRRYDELKQKNQEITLKEVIENINNRDMIDLSREHSPLKKANDAIEIDNSNLTKKETFNKILSIVQSH